MNLFYKNPAISFLVLLLLNFLLIYITERYILTVDFYESSGDIFSGIPGKDTSVYQALQKWIYFSSAVYLILKLGTISLIIYTALQFNSREVTFRNVLKITILAEYLFLVPAAIKIVTFHYTFEHATLLDWHKYYILSAISLFNNVPADWAYALQSFNAIEIGYWFLLGYGIHKITMLSFDQSLRVVITSYVPALVIWIVTVSFFTLVMFPTTG